MRRIFKRIKNIKKHIILFNKIVDKLIEKPDIRNSSDTIEKILNRDCSISRYGDGEFKIINGEDLLFQKYDKELVNRLKEILISNVPNHLVCIPYQIVETNWLNDRSKYFWDNYLSINRYKIYKMIDLKKVYYDSFITRFYMDYRDKKKSELILNQLFKIWNDKDIVIIEGKESRLGAGNDLFFNCKSIERIICPQKDSYSKYKEILTEAMKIEKDKLVLIALGPTATVLAYDLCQRGYRALDIGHIDIEYEWFLLKAKEKVKLTCKFIGEVNDGENVIDIQDDKYYSQIIKII